jgi:CRISPR-associated protein Cmr6
MTAIADAAQKIPMMFRSQVEGRCQLQRIDPRRRGYEKQDVQIWTEQWIDKAEEQPPQFSDSVQTRAYQLTWRFITNSGQDDGVIRPVIGARGMPFYPGSSMKGIFRRAAQQLEQTDEIPVGSCDRYCGKTLSKGDFHPGILRFHGGYPTSNAWTEGLVDIVHPQKEWQVQEHDTRTKPGGAFAQISLYKPELRFGISSTTPLLANEWETIWQIWEKAIAVGIGCRVCAGYGQVQTQSANVLFRCRLKGQGLASKLLDGSLEFRPNVFRAALRGHALRIFGGLTNERNATALVDTLFGGIQRQQAKWGLLSMQFCDRTLDLDPNEGTYNVTGDLSWQSTQPLPPETQAALKELVKRLMQFAMLLGGFGKSWRRADHQLFLEDYENQIIGCHWQWASKNSLLAYNSVRKLEDVSSFIETVQAAAHNWMQIQGIVPRTSLQTDWRESWHLDNVQIWGRLAEDRNNSLAIQWLHREYSYDYKSGREVPISIKGTSVTGKLNQIGRLWHRMYPVVSRKPDPDNDGKFLPKPTPNYLELLTIFPDETQDFNRFLEFLSHERSGFQRLWGK